jgi:protein-tyrosine phosphatase
MRRRRFAWLVAAAAVFLAVLYLASPGWFGANFHEVLPGRVYRSGQLSSAELERAIARYRLRSLINLRGAKPGREWYEKEAEVARRSGLMQEDLDLPPRRLPSRWSVLRLIELLERLPEPILIHCRAGSDRTGFASAVVRMTRGGETLERALSELSLTYGHLSGSPSAEVARFFDHYRAHLAESGEPDTPARFRLWVRTSYVPYGYQARIESRGFPERVRAGSSFEGRFRVSNDSPLTWQFSPGSERGIRLGFLLRTEQEKGWREYNRSGFFNFALAPGRSLDLRVPLDAPRQPGTYWVKLDMVDEHVTWFEQQGSPPLVLRLEVE